MNRIFLGLAVMIVDTNRISSRTLQRLLATKPNVAKVEVYDHLETARRALGSGVFNCLFIDIFSIGIDGGIELIQYLQAKFSDAPICLYSESSDLITMPDVSEYWRKKFGHYLKLGKDQLAQGGGAELDTLLGSLTNRVHKTPTRKKTSGLLARAQRPPAVKPTSPRRATAKEVASGGGAAASEIASPPAVYPPASPMLAREEYGLEIATPLPGAKTSFAAEITGTYKVLPPGQHLWVATAADRETLNSATGATLAAKQYWPQTEATLEAGTEWHARIDNAGGAPGGARTLLVLAVGRNGQVLFEYFRRAGREAKELFEKARASGFVSGHFESWAPLLELTDDVVECASVPITI
jgi:hypothetical protein